MSKFKLLYDVVSIMKDKEVISGVFHAEAKKDQLKIISFTNEFEKNLSSGETRLKISSELDCDGKKVKHESQTEFMMKGCSGHMHRGFLKHMHHSHHGHCQTHEDIKCGGIKEKLTKMAFVLNIFNQIKVDEKDDKSVVLSLNLDDIPDDIKKVFLERLSQRKLAAEHPHHGFMKEFCTLKDPKIGFNLWIRKNREIDKVIVTVEGQQINDLKETHDMSLTLDLQLA